jgi:hypothetical protein
MAKTGAAKTTALTNQEIAIPTETELPTAPQNRYAELMPANCGPNQSPAVIVSATSVVDEISAPITSAMVSNFLVGISFSRATPAGVQLRSLKPQRLAAVITTHYTDTDQPLQRRLLGGAPQRRDAGESSRSHFAWHSKSFPTHRNARAGNVDVQVFRPCAYRVHRSFELGCDEG